MKFAVCFLLFSIFSPIFSNNILPAFIRIDLTLSLEMCIPSEGHLHRLALPLDTNMAAKSDQKSAGSRNPGIILEEIKPSNPKIIFSSKSFRKFPFVYPLSTNSLFYPEEPLLKKINKPKLPLCWKLWNWVLTSHDCLQIKKRGPNRHQILSGWLFDPTIQLLAMAFGNKLMSVQLWRQK